MKWTLVALFVTFQSLCSAQNFDCFGEGLPRANTRQDEVAKGADVFAISMFKDIALNYPRNSIVLSPFSVWSVLKLAYFGASGNTASQLQSALGVPSKSDAFYGGNIVDFNLSLNEGTTFNKADKAYFANGIALHQCAIDKLPEIENVNFDNVQEAVKKINTAVSKATSGKIPKFLSAGVIANARFVLLNAVYFKGNWTFPFIPERTSTRPFYDETRSRNISTATIMATQAKLRHAFSDSLQAAVLELPYEDSNIAMMVILPDPTVATVNSVLQKINSDELDIISSQLKIRTVNVNLPRFKMTTRIAAELQAALKNLGIVDLFDPSKADLSNMIISERVSVSDALHHSTIEVTEEGTVAAAATAIIGTRSGSNDLVHFIADRPFIFLIRDMSQGITLFMGVLRNPNHTTPF